MTLLTRTQGMKWLVALRQRIKVRPDTEFQQALIRLIIGLGFLAYFSSGLIEHPESTSATNIWIAAVFLAISLFILISTLASNQISVARRVLAAIIDFTVTTLLLLIGGETSAPLVAIYFWVPLGNGFRYGIRYLYLSTILASAGYLSVLILNDFWRGNVALGVSILLAIIAVPLYSASLMRQLHQAIAREKEANQAKSQFLANMSHELRTPLNGVIGVADLLAETRLDREQKELAQIIRSSADTLLGLIENVLDISRIEAGRLNLVKEHFDLHLLVSQTVSMLEPVAKKKGLALAAHIAPQTPFHLFGDAAHLRQILINLLGNAVKFTESGRVDLYIRPVGLGTPPTLYFEVVDTGIGIPETAQQDIFTSFTQADPSITRRFGGTGLGTTIAKQLTELMGGRMGFRSSEGVGSVFWFEMPFASATETAETPSSPERMQGRVALLARGEVHARVSDLVSGWGMEVHYLGTEQAIRPALFDMNQPAPLAAIVIENECLSDDPAAFLRSLDLETQNHTPPVILIQSDSTERDLNEARLIRAGYGAVLGSPINPSLLFNAIHAAMSAALPDNVVSIAQRFQSKAGAITLRILVADDNPVNLRVTQGLMEHAGHHVITADDGEEALAVLEAQDAPIDLAIIDMQMPGLSGTDVVRRWRFMEQGHLPIIILTADAREESKRVCQEAGADEFLSKPVNSRILIDTVARLALVETATRMRPQIVRERPSATLDEDILDDLASLGGGLDFVRGLVQEFNRDSLRAFEAIEQALRDRDYPLWKDNFHMLKGGASDVGAQHLAQLCVEAERIQPYEIGTAQSWEKLEQVRAASTQASTALTEYLTRQSSVSQN